MSGEPRVDDVDDDVDSVRLDEDEDEDEEGGEEDGADVDEDDAASSINASNCWLRCTFSRIERL